MQDTSPRLHRDRYMLVTALGRVCGGRLAGEPAMAERRVRYAPALRGAHQPSWLLDGPWRQLSVDRALRQALGGRRFTTDVERVLVALVAKRCVEPRSKLSAAE